MGSFWGIAFYRFQAQRKGDAQGTLAPPVFWEKGQKMLQVFSCHLIIIYNESNLSLSLSLIHFTMYFRGIAEAKYLGGPDIPTDQFFQGFYLKFQIF